MYTALLMCRVSHAHASLHDYGLVSHGRPQHHLWLPSLQQAAEGLLICLRGWFQHCAHTPREAQRAPPGFTVVRLMADLGLASCCRDRRACGVEAAGAWCRGTRGVIVKGAGGGGQCSACHLQAQGRAGGLMQEAPTGDSAWPAACDWLGTAMRTRGEAPPPSSRRWS